MPPSTLTPVFVGLRVGLHALFVGLTAFVVVRAVVVGAPHLPAVLIVAGGFIAVYLVGAGWARGGVHAVSGAFALGWVAALSGLWGFLVWLTPEGAFLVFPLFFMYLHLLPGVWGVVAVGVSAALAIVSLGMHIGFTVGGVIGPIVAAAVAVLIGLAYRALRRESAERDRLLAELLHTRAQLAETEREQGALAERARLAREIHDTVAQGLSSIQMLLRAAERDAVEPSAAHLRLARETAADSLRETRQIIRQLTPSRLDDGLGAALHRLGAEQSHAPFRVDVHTEDIDLPMDAQIALLRIAQGALANAARHAEPSRVTLTLTAPDDDSVLLAVGDDGRGFDPGAVAAAGASTSFGMRAMRERVDQLGGALEVVSAPGEGARVVVRLPRHGVGVGET
ncbi:MAG: two-component sensor histidine kinase [Microbacterium sp.]|nr:two-component sensor histidine kinase [Microbacterium sp.]